MILNDWRLVLMLCIVAAHAAVSWPTLKLKILKYNYYIHEPDFLNFTITEKDGEQMAYYELKKDNMMIFINNVATFGDNSGIYIEFMNKTIDICKLLSNRRYEPLVGIFYRVFREKEPSLPMKCPITKVCINQIDYERSIYKYRDRERKMSVTVQLSCEVN